MELENISLSDISSFSIVFFNTLTADDKYSLRNSENSYNQFKYSYLKKQKYVCQFFASFLNLHKVLNIFKKRMTLIGYVFPT